jgi:hypothetical protein
MRTAHRWSIVLVLAGFGVAASCGGSGSGNAGGGGGTGGDTTPGTGGRSSTGGGGTTLSTSTTSTAASTGASTSSTTGGTGGNGGSGNGGGTVTLTLTSQGTGGSGGASCGSLMFSDPACQSCADGSCCAEVTACDTGTGCYKIINCIAAGHDATTCYNQHPNGQAPYDALTTCLGGSCGAECGYCPGNALQYGDPNLAACNTCINGSCCAEYSQLTVDYNADPGCGTGGACPPTDDLNTCEGDPTNAVCTTDPDAAAAAACVVANCPDSCPLPICDSGIVVTGPVDCASCLGTNCCAEFEAFKCAPPAGNACMTNLADFNSCATDPTCNGNAVAQAANACDTMANCHAICGF